MGTNTNATITTTSTSTNCWPNISGITGSAITTLPITNGITYPYYPAYPSGVTTGLFNNGVFTGTSVGTWIDENANAMLNFSWIIARLSYIKFPRRIKHPICTKCKQLENNFVVTPPNLEELFKTKCLYCHKAAKNLFVWKDDPPDNCPYTLEHLVAEDHAEKEKLIVENDAEQKNM